MTGPRYAPRLNHVAFTVDRALMDDAGRATFCDFFAEVFGWTEGDNSGESGNPLILYTGAPLQFVYLLPGDQPLTAPHLDHFGLELSSVEELEEVVAKARRYRQRDPRVEIVEVAQRVTHGPTHDYTLTSAYIGFLLPLMIELQHVARGEPTGATDPG